MRIVCYCFVKGGDDDIEEPWQQCKVFLAPSNTGWGVFAAQDIKKGENIDLPPAKSIWRMLLESSEDECQELVKELMEKSDRLKTEATNIGHVLQQFEARL